MDKVTIELTKDELDSLTICIGFAVGAAHERKDQQMANYFLEVANAVHRNNPQWTPYEVDPR